MLAVPGALAPAQADPGAVAAPASPGTVASTLAAAATPPAPTTALGSRDQTAGFSPYARVMAGSYAQNPSMENFATGVHLGRDINLGPGQDYTTQAEIAKAKAVPYDTTVGTTHHVPGGALPETTTSGGSPYDEGVARTESAANPADAKHMIDVGADANVNLGKTQAILTAYNTTVAPEYTPGGILSEKAAANAAAYFNLPVADILKMGAPGVKAMIRKQFASMVSNLRDNMGNPLIKGSLDTIMLQFPDPDSSPAQFRAATQSLMTTLQQQKADGDAALNWYAKPTREGYVELLRQQAQHAAQARGAFANAGLTGGGEGESGAGKTTADGGGLRAPTPQELDAYHKAVAAGRDPAEVQDIFRVRHHVDPTQLK